MNRDPFRPVLPGWEQRISGWLIPGYVAGSGLPLLAMLAMHLRQPPGPPGVAWIKSTGVFDAMAMALAVFDASAVFTVALACLIVTLMKARPRHADPMPLPAD
jgi:hypothetical protein